MAKSAAERAREYRARKASERAAEEAAARDARDAEAPRVMRDAVEASLAAMKWIAPSDAASVAQARSLAEDVDLLRHAGDTNRALSAQRALSRVLNDLGGTPTVRMQHELRSLKAAKRTEGADDGDSVPTPDNVTKLERPAKRAR